MTMTMRKLAFVSFAVTALVLYVVWQYSMRTDVTVPDLRNPEREAGVPGGGVQHDKWIVVTSIQLPTRDLQQIVKLSGWQLLVVGDRKTPQDWKLDGAIFLDVQHQKALGYRTTKLLPLDSYTRKVVGYLYAIEHGAEYIYDTDDDNCPKHLLDTWFDTSNYGGQSIVVDTENLTFNPYPYFGQASMWPRGFPLDFVRSSHSHHQFKICATNRPAIQQGLVNGDPDVDAIFRLTRAKSGEPIELSFDSTAPSVVLPQGTLAPTNSQNTLYTARAFWGMILPTTVAFRACDIFRSYWSQRLLWLNGDSAAFYPPNADQIRNSHSYKKDFRDETEIFFDMEDLLLFLRKWTCSKVVFFDCMIELAHDMAKATFWGTRDAELVEAWAADLASLGYVPPTMQKSQTCHSEESTPVLFYPIEQSAVYPHTGYVAPQPLHSLLAKDFVRGVCPSQSRPAEATATQKVYSDILLIIQLRDASFIPASEALYRKRFPCVLYCGDLPLAGNVKKVVHKWGVSYVRVPHGAGVVPCVSAAMNMKYYVNGFMFISDSMLLKVDRLADKDAGRMWMTRELHVDSPEMLQQCNVDLNCRGVSKEKITKLNTQMHQMKVEDRTRARLQNCSKIMSTQEEVLHLTDLAVYVPSRATHVFQETSKVYLKSDLVDYSFVTVLLLGCLEVAPEYLSFVSTKDAPTQVKFEYVYPFKWREVVNQGTVENAQFCQHIPN